VTHLVTHLQRAAELRLHVWSCFVAPSGGSNGADYPASKWVIIGMVHAQTGASHLAEARRYGTDRVSAKDIMAQLGSVDP